MDDVIGQQVSGPVPAVVTEAFTLENLSGVRDLVRSAAGGDVDVDDLDRLLIAVTEIAGNAVRYAGGTGRITLRRQGGRLIVEITDDGPGLPADLSMERPAVTALGGRGLWLAHAMCDDITIVSGPGGVTVTMTVACRDGG